MSIFNYYKRTPEMPEIRKFHPTNLLILSLPLVFLLLSFGIAPAAETLNITNYYPSPQGDYNHLTTHSDTYLATDEGNVGIGTTSPEATLHVSGTAILPAGLIGQIETVSPATDASTTSTSFVDMPGMSITLTTRANSKLLIFWNVTMAVNAQYTWGVTRVLVDGVQQGLLGGAHSYQGPLDSIGGNAVATVATADSHTVKLQWRVSGAAMGYNYPATYPTYYGRTLTVVEVYQ